MLYLFVLQGANYVLPLITIPYLVRVLGPENFGKIAFAQAFIQYFVVLTDYGFNLSATRAIALIRDDPQKLSNLYSAVMIVKVALMLIGLAMMFLIVGLVPRFEQDRTLYVLVYLTVLGNVLFPVWLFQGLEHMRLITVLSLLARLMMVIAIFTLVHSQSDYHLAAAVQAGSLVIAGVISLVIVSRVFNVHLRWPKLVEIKMVAQDGWHVFLSTAAISLYTSSNVFILGVVTNPTVVGFFSAADKIVRAVQGLISPVSQAVYPYIAALTAKSHGAALSFIRGLFIWQGGGTFVLSVVLFFSAEPLVEALFGEAFKASILLVEWMAALPFLIGISNIFGIQTMLNFDMKRVFGFILTASGVLNIVLIIPLSYWLGAQGAAISVLLTEVAVAALMAWVLARQGLLRPIVMMS